MTACRAILIFAILVAALLHFHAPLVNGIPGIWEWNWRIPPPYYAYLYLLAFSFPSFIGLYWTLARPDMAPAIKLFAFMLGFFLLQFAGIYVEQLDFSRISDIIQSPYATSYYTDATRIHDLHEWLATFHLQELHLHSRTHPAGPVLYHYVFLTIFGPDIAPLAIGTSIALLASLGIPAIWKLGSSYATDERTRLLAVALYAMTPGLVLFFPEFDQAYAALSAIMLYTWNRSINGSYIHIFHSSLLLVLATAFAYNLLVLGTYYVLHAAYRLHISRERAATLRWLGLVVIIHIAIILCTYLLLYRTFDYNPILAFNSALSHQSELEAILDRPHSIAIFYNIYDFILGGGFVSFALCIAYVVTTAKQAVVANQPSFALVIIGWITVIITSITGLLDYETARVWLFMQPFLIIPAAISLQSFTSKEVTYIFFSAWLILATIKINLVFIG